MLEVSHTPQASFKKAITKHYKHDYCLEIVESKNATYAYHHKSTRIKKWTNRKKNCIFAFSIIN